MRIPCIEMSFWSKPCRCTYCRATFLAVPGQERTGCDLCGWTAEGRVWVTDALFWLVR